MKRKLLVPVYVLILAIIVGACTTWSFGWAVNHVLTAKYNYKAQSRLGNFGETIVAVADFPQLVKKTLKKIGNIF